MDTSSLIKTVLWNDLKPGMIILENIDVAGRPLADTIGLMPLDEEKIQRIRKEIHLSKDRPIRVMFVGNSAHAETIARRLQAEERQIRRVNHFRKKIKDVFDSLDVEPGELYLPEKDLIVPDRLLMDYYNSIHLKTIPQRLPSYIHDLEQSLNFADMITGSLPSKLKLPQGEPCVLHIVLDASYSVKGVGLGDIFKETANFLGERIQAAFKMTEVRPYVFSDECKRVEFPVRMQAIPNRGTSYASFLRSIISNRDRQKRNLVLLITDGEPEDLENCKSLARTFRKFEMDFIQICFVMNRKTDVLMVPRGTKLNKIDGIILKGSQGELYPVASDAEFTKFENQKFDRFTDFADMVNGNQIVIKEEEALSAFAIDVYDRYMGILTVADGMN
ncbi:MAG: hypothetical protein OEZ34_11805 [Spirochaetia bacterium]|nr:hypothetical protein [Spirochaetia bacterium]